MSPETFIEQVKRMQKWSFDEARLARIWNYVSELRDADFIRIVDRMLDTAKSQPLPEDFRLAAKPFSRQPPASPPVLEMRATCAECGDLGWLWLDHADISGVVVKCLCPAGQDNKQNKAIPYRTRGMPARRIDPRLFIPNQPTADFFNNDRVRWWASVLNKSERYWQDHPQTGAEQWWQK